MPLMSLANVRVQDPILTNVVQGYQQAEFVGTYLFPIVPVDKRSGYVIEFTKDDFAVFDTLRTPGSATKRRTINYGNRQFVLKDYSIEGELPLEHLEESQGVPGIDLQAEAAASAMRAIELQLENDIATIALNASNYGSSNKVTLSGTDRWDDPGSDPVALVNDWREAVRSQLGVYPNTMIMGPKVFNAAENNPLLRDRIKYVSADSITTDSLARMFKLDRGIKVGQALKLNDDGTTLDDVWSSSVVLAYVPPTISTQRVASFGYTYSLRNYPIAEEPYLDRNHKTWYFPVTAVRQPLLTGQAAGFLASTVVS